MKKSYRFAWILFLACLGCKQKPENPELLLYSEIKVKPTFADSIITNTPLPISGYRLDSISTRAILRQAYTNCAIA